VPTTNLYAHVSSIEISGLTGALAPAVLKLKDESNGQAHDQLFASNTAAMNGTVGHGSWDAMNSKLTLYLVEDMECNGEYLFSFEVQNPDAGKVASSVSIEAFAVHPLKSGVGIEKAAMVPDEELIPVQGGMEGDAMPLRIRDPEFTTRLIAQESSTPCAQNEIGVVLVANVPLFAVCGPKITLKGLTGADTASVGNMTVSQSSTALGSTAAWEQSNGSLVVTIVEDFADGDELSFTFNLQNPSRGQSGSPVSVAVSDGIKFSEAMMKTPMDTGGWTPWPGTPVVADLDGEGDHNAPAYPLSVDTAFLVEKKIGQSSPWPCDNNTVTVALKISTTLLSSCAPTVTLEGLLGMQTNSSSVLPVHDAHGGAAAVADWDQDTGELVLDLTTLGHVADVTAQVSGSDPNISTSLPRIPMYVHTALFEFSFDLVNPAAARGRVAVSIITSIVSVNNITQKQAIMANNSDSESSTVGVDSVVLDNLDREQQSWPVPTLEAVCYDEPTWTSGWADTCTNWVNPVVPECSWVENNWNEDTDMVHGGATSKEDCVSKVRQHCPYATIASYNATDDSCFCQSGTNMTENVGASRENCLLSTIGVPDACLSSCTWVEHNWNIEGEVQVANASSREECIALVQANCPGATIARYEMGGGASKECYCQFGTNMTENVGGGYENCLLSTVDTPADVKTNCRRTCGNTHPGGQRPSWACSAEQFGARNSSDDDFGYIRPIEFLVQKIGQRRRDSNANKATDPCSPITVSVTLATSVPLLSACPTEVTIKGLTDTPYFDQTRLQRTIPTWMSHLEFSGTKIIHLTNPSAAGSWRSRRTQKPVSSTSLNSRCCKRRPSSMAWTQCMWNPAGFSVALLLGL
jgi:hypothetical protein